MDEKKKNPDSILKDVFEAERQEDPDARIQELGKEFVNRLFMLYRTGRVHDLENDAVTNAIRALHQVIQDISMYMKDIQLQAVGDSFYLNKVLLKVDFSTFENFRFLSDVLKKLELAGFVFVDPSPEDLKQLLVAWKHSPEDPSDKNWLGHFDRPTVSVTPASEIEESKTRMISAETLSDPSYLLRLYMKSLFGVRFFVQSLQKGDFISLSGLQRSVHEFIDAMGKDTKNTLALSTIRISEDRFSSSAVNVTLLSLLLGRELGLPRNKLSDLGMAAFLHDVGRVSIPKNILNKANALTEAEKKKIDQSNHLSLMQLVKLRGFNESALRRMLVAFEHTLDAKEEKGFKRPTVLARIVAITHCFVAMTTSQPYRDAMLPSEALKIMSNDGQTKFDPVLLKSFARLLTLYPPGSLVVTSNREVAIITDSFKERPHAFAPEIAILYDRDGKRTKEGEQIARLSGADSSRVLKALDPSKFQINPLRTVFPLITEEVDFSTNQGDSQ